MDASHFPAIGRYRFHFKLLDPLRLPAYPGSTWRGLLGHGLRQAACVTHQPECTGCLLLSGCAYSRLFETPAPDGSDPRHRNRPHPYILNISPSQQENYRAGDPLQLGINLIGGANHTLPYLIHALTLAGQRGLGKRHARFQLTQAKQHSGGHWQPIYQAGGTLQPQPATTPQPPAAADTAAIQLLTPLRLKYRGRLLRPEQLDQQQLSHHLRRRLQDLAHFHGSQPPGGKAPQIEFPAADTLSITSQLHWHDWTRYSSRQQTNMQMGGLLGSIQLSGPGLAQLWPWLWLGQHTHLGKGTSLGLGQYRLQPSD